MWKTVMAGLLSMTALAPPAQAQAQAQAQDGRSMDRGTWRRERAERPDPPAVAMPRPKPERDIGSDSRQRDGRPVFGGRERGDRQWVERGGDRRRMDRDDPRPANTDGGWRGNVDRRGEPGGGYREGDGDRGRERGRDRGMSRAVPADRVWRSDRAVPRQRFGGYDRAPSSTIWRSGRAAGWDRDWRRDPRYDWNRYRTQRGAAFRLPRYYAPYGWDGGYRRFGVGVPLASMLYTPHYWIYDPYTYRLPDAGEPYRWVRYYDDALLVDIEDGIVADVIHGIFD